MNKRHQSISVAIEHILTPRGYCKLGDACIIDKDPIGYLDLYVLDDLEKKSIESEKKVCCFYDIYEKYKGKSMSEIDEVVCSQLQKDVRELFK